MATNYTFAQVCKIINDGNDTEALIDIGRRFPLLMHAVSQVTAIAGNKFVDLMGFMPDYVTAKKFDAALRSGAAAESDDTEDDETETEPKSTGKTAAEPKETKNDETDEEPTNGDNYDSMTAKEIWKLMCERGLDKTVKSTKKGDRIAALREYDANNAGVTTKDEDEDGDEAEEVKENPYDGKKAPELFKECKKRGLKAEPKKPAKYYVDLLLADDAAQKDTSSDDSDENWDDDDAEEEAPKKSIGKKAPKEKNTKPAKKAAQSEDEDDNWDI